ncbi:MAG: hypothetical protein ACREE6_16675, partial [Limisphaerales bacterium]
MKSSIQIRAEGLAQDFKKQGRKPIVIEFAGTPTREACARLGNLFRIFEVNTSLPGSDKKKTAEKVAGVVLDLISEQLEEEILCVGKIDARRLFDGKTSISGSKAAELINLFVEKGS